MCGALAWSLCRVRVVGVDIEKVHCSGAAVCDVVPDAGATRHLVLAAHVGNACMGHAPEVPP